MIEIDFYTALKLIRQENVPYSVIFTELSLTKNEGGNLRRLDNQIEGANQKNINDKYMIGLQDIETGQIRHIYIHTILQLIINNVHYKLVLK